MPQSSFVAVGWVGDGGEAGAGPKRRSPSIPDSLLKFALTVSKSSVHRLWIPQFPVYDSSSTLRLKNNAPITSPHQGTDDDFGKARSPFVGGRLVTDTFHI